MSTAYDEVTYPSAIHHQTHPDGLGVIGMLSGMRPAPVKSCRVLELGCGDGWNLISMAYGLPGSDFVGIDLAAKAIARGNALVQQLGARNVALHARDVTDAAPDLGEFDYIIAHGLYSWVPPAVQEKILELCQTKLSARGIAYISYNAYPGNHLRDLIRGAMRYHASHFRAPSDQIKQARGVVRLLVEAGDENDAYTQLLRRELERIKGYSDAGFFHDDLSSINQPVYFHEFMAAAEHRGLQFLGESELTEKQERRYPPQVEAVLQQLDPADVIGAEQYRDFLRCRSFRCTLLCHKGIKLERNLLPGKIRELLISGDIRPASEGAEPNAPEVFYGLKKSELETSHPVMKAALRAIGTAWPECLPFAQILATARAELHRRGDERLETDAAQLAGALLQAAIAGAVELHTHRPDFVLEPGERPVASRLAQIQLRESTRVTSMLHRSVQLDDAITRMLLLLSDGSRDRATLCEDLNAAIREGKVPPPGFTQTVSEAEVDGALRGIAKLGLLLA